MEGRPESVIELPALVDRLCEPDRQRWLELYDLSLSVSGCSVPPEFTEKLQKWFGKQSDADPAASALERVQQQRVLSVFNKQSCEEVRFNSLRVSRPHPLTTAGCVEATQAELEELYSATCGEEKCDFCAWKTRTASDVWGRVFGKAGCVTASNVAKANMDHGVVILPVHHPLRALTCEIVTDVFETAVLWSRSCVRQRSRTGPSPLEKGGRYFPQLLWNCGMGSGASQPHGHAQVILGYGRAPGREEASRRAASAHGARTGRDYWGDVLWCHRTAGLAVALPLRGGGAGTLDDGSVHVLAYLTPLASHELLVLGRTPTAVGKGVYFASQVLQERFKARCFNISCALPPLAEDLAGIQEADAERPAKRGKLADEPWIVARVLDQTDKPMANGTPFGATFATFELYGPVVDDFDLYRTAQYLREAAEAWRDA